MTTGSRGLDTPSSASLPRATRPAEALPRPAQPAETARVRPGSWRTNGPLAAGFARLAGRVTRTAPPAIFTVLGRGRRTFWGWLAFAGSLMPFGSLPRADSELVILRVARLRDSDYETAHHRHIAQRAGVTADQIEQLLSETPEASYFSDRQQALLAATDELIATDDLSDPTWQQLHGHLGDRGCVEFLLLAGHYRMLATALHTMRIEPDQPR
ncbi:MAG TPA: carboxymuconolactone decarboxylase family protein [Flexivirga sp.]|uniref:carboxymuconolactone decarboxylase family protein n=1 Tax=Flexivirga sp. TaxID=1962927 RepID=UPI002BD560F5|nr:carboxymuconolactone decarboxylase family protein [Flexivirga sp.]HWC20957.1 carboxymuconolactone decarboxylase family protein [Flexivirga sp.]